MTLRGLPSAQALLRGLGQGARAAGRHAALVAAAVVTGAVGCGFLVFAAFAGLRLWLGPELAALGIGIALLALAWVLFRLPQDDATGTQAGAMLPPEPSRSPADPATLAVFTAAFVLGRRLADRWRD